MALLFLVVYIPVPKVHEIFNTTPLTVEEWLAVAPLMLLPAAVAEIRSWCCSGQSGFPREGQHPHSFEKPERRGGSPGGPPLALSRSGELRLGRKGIADARDGQDVPWVAWIGLDLDAQPADQPAHEVALAVACVPPDQFHKHLGG